MGTDADIQDQDPEIVSIWIKSRLLEDAQIVSIIGQRANDDVADLSDTKFPFVYWSGDQISANYNAGGTTQVIWQFDVRATWNTAVTGPSRAPCRPLSRAIKRVLCDTENYRAEVPGVGWVWECKFLRWYRPPARVESGKKIIEHGVTIFLITS